MVHDLHIFDVLLEMEMMKLVYSLMQFYTHPLSNKKFRSMISVLNFIRSSNNILNPLNLGNSEQEPQIQVRVSCVATKFDGA